MSKKKVSGNTMTLKDFHGGFIPSDLPLPSAPGIIVKPSDRPSYERSSSWGNQMGRSDLRSRPHTSPATRHFEDKAPFLTHAAHIGRNFDEDERKPLDGMSAPRRTISDESIRVPPTRAELKPESAPTGGSWGRQGWAPTSQVPSGGNSYSGRVIEPSYVGVNSQNFDSNVGQGLGGAYQNAWAARKEAAVVTERQQAAWSAPVAVSKLAHASALEKVLSGRWQSKLSSPNQADVEVIISSETESALHFKGYGTNTHNTIDVMSGMENYEATLASHAERGLNIVDNVHAGRKELYDYERARAPTNLEVKERNLTSHDERGLNVVDNVHGGRKELYDYERARAPTNLEVKERNLTSHAERGLNIVDSVHGGRKELYDYERPRAPTNAEVKERNLTNYRDRGQPEHVDGKLGWSDSQTSLHLDPSERPKLKLVPRTKTVESMEPPPVVHHTEQATESVHVESFNEVHGNMMHAKPALASTESGKQPVERPKLNLKPRSQPVEKLEGNSERGRNALFGGARPRELVLKERGIDDVAINHDLVQQSEKVEHHVPRTERVPAPVHTNALHPSEKTENLPHDQRGGKRTEKRDHLVDVERMDNQRRNWRNESRRNNRETEKHQHHHPERAPSPETWRKPIEQQPRPISADSSGPRYLKAASAVELAQSFSKSVSDPSIVQHSGQRGALPGRGQVPFSRLMGQTARPQINGY